MTPALGRPGLVPRVPMARMAAYRGPMDYGRAYDCRFCFDYRQISIKWKRKKRLEAAYVFIMGRRQKKLDAALKAIGSNVTGVQGDITKLADLDRLYEAVKAMGKLFVTPRAGKFQPGDPWEPIGLSGKRTH